MLNCSINSEDLIFIEKCAKMNVISDKNSLTVRNKKTIKYYLPWTK